MTLAAATVLSTGVQTVRSTFGGRNPEPSPCCGASMSRVLTDPPTQLAWSRPGIGSADHPFRCETCGKGYAIRPSETGRVLVEVTR